MPYGAIRKIIRRGRVRVVLFFPFYFLFLSLFLREQNDADSNDPGGGVALRSDPVVRGTKKKLFFEKIRSDPVAACFFRVGMPPRPRNRSVRESRAEFLPRSDRARSHLLLPRAGVQLCVKARAHRHALVSK